MVGLWRIELVVRNVFGESDSSLVHGVVKRLAHGKHFRPIEGVRSVVEVITPYADVLPFAEEHVVQEANPTAAFSFLTALVHHGLSDEIPGRSMQLTDFSADVSRPFRLPIGTRPEDWIETGLPSATRPMHVGKVRVEWTRAESPHDFGIATSSMHGQAVYVTDRDRTILDAIRRPARVGGVLRAFQALARAKATLQVNRLIEYTELLGLATMRQRIGYLLEHMGFQHAKLDEWASHTQRGGSMRLVANAPYAPGYSERWDLSLNVPGDILELIGLGA